MPGWVDQVTPLGCIGYPYAMGMSRHFYFPNRIFDHIPADIVTNQILVSTAFQSTTPVPELKIFHNSITGSNPFKINDFWESGIEYLKFNPYEKQVRDIGFWHSGNKKWSNSVVYLNDDLPALLTGAFAKLPFVGSKKV